MPPIRVVAAQGCEPANKTIKTRDYELCMLSSFAQVTER